MLDFTKKQSNLVIMTDATERSQGLSNATITFQDSQLNKSHFFYAHLEPQPNGAAFAGFKLKQHLDLSWFEIIHLNLKNLVTSESTYQLVLTTKQSDEQGFTYKSDFTLHDSVESTVSLKLSRFSATRRGTPKPDAPSLDMANIHSIGIRVVGRVSEQQFQQGLFALQLKAITFE